MSDITVTEDLFGRLESDDGKEEAAIRRFTLENRNGMSVQLIDYGAAISSVKVPDKNGNARDVVLGFDTVQEYVNSRYYFGATIGRFCNRIAFGRFLIGSEEYRLNRNENENHLHGGTKGFDKMVWDASVEGNSVVFLHRSLSRHEKYPGDLTARVIYSLNAENELRIVYRVSEITAQTPVNLTNHSYFNLTGHDSGCKIVNHFVQINSAYYLPVDSKSIPTGEIRSVEGTPFDLRSGAKLNRLESLPGSGGYDHNFCLGDQNDQDHRDLRTVATIYDDASGISLRVSSDQPGVQFYTANFLPSDESLRGKNGAIYGKHSAFCLETQNYPDAVNKEHFPGCFYGPGDTYERTTIYRFAVGNDN